MQKPLHMITNLEGPHMRKTLAILAIPAVLFGTIAADGDAPTPCAPDAEVMASGDSVTFNPTGVESFSFKVDPTTTDKGRVTVDAELVWDTTVNDWDLGINGTLSENYQPIDPAQENVSFTAKGNCKTITVEVIDFLAPVPELGMTLTVSVR